MTTKLEAVEAPAAVKRQGSTAVKKTAPAKKAAAPKVAAKAVEGPVYVALRRFSSNGNDYKPGDVVPEASAWSRVETWIRARYIAVKES